MAVVHLNIGPRRVHVTAYCPEDELGLIACQYVLGFLKDKLSNVTEEEFRAWLISKDPDYAKLFHLLDSGNFILPKNDQFAVDPTNVQQELRIIKHLLLEAIDQGRLKLKAPSDKK